MTATVNNAASSVAEEEEVPQSLLVSNSQDVITFHLVYSLNDLQPATVRRSFKPHYVYQIFGASQAIYGYRNLAIDIYFTANSANCLVKIKHNPLPRNARGPPPDDILQKLNRWLPNPYYKTEKLFRDVVKSENHSTMYGKVVDEFVMYNKCDAVPYKYLITECSATEPGFVEFHERFECYIVWFIDAASHIAISNDPNWMIHYVYEERRIPGSNRFGYYPVGFCTVYKFFHFPDKIRTRISQIFIIPPCQRTGIGIKLLSATYNAIYKLPNVKDITVEDPCEGFTRMRDLLDCRLVTQLESFKYPLIYRGFTRKMLQEAGFHFKLNRRQCLRVYQILRMAHTFVRQDNSGYRYLYKDIQSHIEAPYKREQECVKRKRLLAPKRLCRSDSYTFHPLETEEDIIKLVDTHFHEIKQSAYLIAKKLDMKRVPL